MKKLFLGMVVFIVAYVLTGAFVDKVVFPEAEPGPDYYPREG